MEKEKKNRGKIFLTIAVTVNILFSVVSSGFLIYKVRSLEEQVFQLQKDSSKTGQTRERQNEAWDDLAHRRKRAAESLGETKSCTTCHNACVKLFGLGAPAKVSAIILDCDACQSQYNSSALTAIEMIKSLKCMLFCFWLHKSKDLGKLFLDLLLVFCLKFV